MTIRALGATLSLGDLTPAEYKKLLGPTLDALRALADLVSKFGRPEGRLVRDAEDILATWNRKTEWARVRRDAAREQDLRRWEAAEYWDRISRAIEEEP